MAEENGAINTETTTPKKAPAKKVATKAKTKKNTTNKKVPAKKAVVKQPRSYPTVTLEKCLIIAQKIKELNGGNAWNPKDLADAVNIRDTSKLFYYLAASRDFGLTTGGVKSNEIELTDFGRSLVYAPSPEVEREKKIEAFLKIDIFKNVLD